MCSTLSRTACHTSSYRWREMSLKCELSMSLELPPPSSTKLLSTLTLNGRRLTRLSSSPGSLGHWSLHRTAAGQDHDHNFRTLSLWFVCQDASCQPEDTATTHNIHFSTHNSALPDFSQFFQTSGLSTIMVTESPRCLKVDVARSSFCVDDGLQTQ